MTVAKVILVAIIVVKTISVISLKAEKNEDVAEKHKKDIVYHFMYKTDNGIERNEEAVSKETPQGKVLSIAGSYEYEDNGIITLVTYIADENGFKPIFQIRRRINNVVPLNFTLDNRIDPKLLGTLAGGGLG